jgi:predicted DNA-binding protein (UPF0251 family)
MPRPVKCRRVGFEPGVTYYKPRGIPLRELDEVELGVDELEALRLADTLGLSQEEGAARMRVSRATFGRILESAHRAVAEALVQGKAIRIEGGVVEMETRTFACSACGREWQAPFGTGRPAACPECGSDDFHRVGGRSGIGGGPGRGGGRCRRGQGPRRAE